MEFITNVICQ